MRPSNSIPLLTLALSQVLSACKPEHSSSNIQTLDNFAAGKRIVTNECKGNEPSLAFNRMLPPIGKVATEKRGQNEAAINESLSAIPKDIQRLFVALKGRILVSDGANDICTAHFKSPDAQRYLAEGMEDIRGCLVFHPATKTHLQILNIVLVPDPIEIKHSMGRIFGGFVSELVQRISVDANGNAKMNDIETPDAKAQKQIFATSFLRALFQSHEKQLQNISFLFGDYGFAELQRVLENQDLIDEENIFNRVSFENSREEIYSDRNLRSREERTTNFISAEAFDSYFCNSIVDPQSGKNTRENFKKQFRQLFYKFENALWPKLIQSLEAKIAAAEKTVFFAEEDSSAASSGMFLLGDTDESTSGLQLAGNSGYESPWWAGTKAAFGSIWDNTGGAASRGYDSYKRNVAAAVDKVYDGNIASTAVKAVGKVGADAYGDYYDRTYEKTGKRIETLQSGGMSNRASVGYGVALAVGDVTGITNLAEAYEGFDVDQKRDLNSWERAQKAAQGTAAAAGTAAGVLSMTSRVASAPLNIADDVARTGSRVADDVVRGLCLADALPASQVTQPNGRVNANKPAYVDPGTHSPTRAPRLGKEIMPPNAESLYRRAVPDPTSVQSNGFAKKWYSTDAAGNVHRFQMDEVGKAHWNGSDRAVSSNKNPIQKREIDINVRRRLGC